MSGEVHVARTVRTGWSTLFCLYQQDLVSLPPGGQGDRSGPPLFGVLPDLHFSSTWYLITPEWPSREMSLDRALKTASALLDQHRFMQVTVRPVHAVSKEDPHRWIRVYERFLPDWNRFQQEGYRQQILSRLRIFPVIFLPDAGAIEAARPLLVFLTRTFLLPSVLIPHQDADLLRGLRAGRNEGLWERTYVTRSREFHPGEVLGVLHAHTILDACSSDAGGRLADQTPACRNLAILTPTGRVCSCILEAGIRAPCGQGRGRPKTSPLSGDHGRAGCLDCLIPAMDLLGAAYRLNDQGTDWNRLCEGLAGRLVHEGRYEEALKVFGAWPHGSPSGAVPPALRANMALCYYHLGDLDRAMGELERARAHAPDSPEIRYGMGLCEFAWKDYIEAADRFQEAIALGLGGSRLQEAHFYRGLSHYHLEEYDEGLEALQKAEQEGLRDSPVCFYQGLCLLGKNRPEDALIRFQEALARGPSMEDLFHVLFYIAYAFKETGAFDRALNYCARAQGIRPRSKEVWNLMGFCHFKKRDYDAAIECFGRAIEIDPTSAIDYANIGSNLRDKGDLRGAIAMYRKALSLDPTIDFARESLNRLLNSGAGSDPDRSDPETQKP